MTDFDHPDNRFPDPGTPPLWTTAGRRPANAVWNEAEAAKAVGFFADYLKHTQGLVAGEPFILAPEQAWLVREAFGWYVPSALGLVRLYRYVYVEMGRGNGKSQLGAGIAGKLLFADGEPKPIITGCAADRPQAKIILGRLKDMIAASPKLAAKADSQASLINHLSNGGVYRARSADVKGAWGGSPHGIVFDELHAQPGFDLWKAETTAMGKRKQPMCWAFTTAGHNRESLCYGEHQKVVAIAKGEFEQPNLLGVIWAAPDDADWTDPAIWQAANPMMSLPGSKYTKSGALAAVLYEYVEAECAVALNNPIEQNAFRTLYLSQWVGQVTRYIPMLAWDACAGPIAPSKREAFGGLDLASTTDLAAFSVVSEHDGVVDTEVMLFAPADGLLERARRDRVPYDVWALAGFLTLTPGPVIDQDFIEAAVKAAASKYDLRDVGYDRWNASQLVVKLAREGVEMVEVGQGYASMSAPTKELLRLTLESKLRHGDNPALRWMVDNTAVTVDAAGNVKPDKSKSNGRIDGVVATVMAIDGLTRRGRSEPAKSVYETRGLRYI